MDNAKTAIYCRVACPDDMALRNQSELVSRFAVDNGYTDCVNYCDCGSNGLSLNRPGFNALMVDARGGRVKTVIVKDISRIARDYTVFYKWIDEMERLGVTFVSVIEGKFTMDNDLLADIKRQILAAYNASKRKRVAK